MAIFWSTLISPLSFAYGYHACSIRSGTRSNKQFTLFIIDGSSCLLSYQDFSSFQFYQETTFESIIVFMYKYFLINIFFQISDTRISDNLLIVKKIVETQILFLLKVDSKFMYEVGSVFSRLVINRDAVLFRTICSAATALQ